MFIDCNGDVLVCCNDWGRRGIIGNLLNNSIKDLWLSKNMDKFRLNLQNGDRSKLDPCRYCNIQGTKYGKDSFDFFKEHYLK